MHTVGMSLSCDVLVTTTLLSPIVALQPPAQFQIYTNTIFAFLKNYLVLPCMIVAPPNVTVSITWTGLIPSDAFISRSNALVFAQPMGGEYTCHAQGGRASIDLIYNVAIRGKREGEEGRGRGKGKREEGRGRGKREGEEVRGKGKREGEEVRGKGKRSWLYEVRGKGKRSWLYEVRGKGKRSWLLKHQAIRIAKKTIWEFNNAIFNSLTSLQKQHVT